MLAGSTTAGSSLSPVVETPELNDSSTLTGDIRNRVVSCCGSFLFREDQHRIWHILPTRRPSSPVRWSCGWSSCASKFITKTTVFKSLKKDGALTQADGFG
jgi:hypothetical protein